MRVRRGLALLLAAGLSVIPSNFADLASNSATSSSTESAGSVRLWEIKNERNRRVLSEGSEEIELDNRNLATVGDKFFFDFAAHKVAGLEDGVSVIFDVPEDGKIVTKDCIVKRGNPLVTKKTLNKFPELAIFKGFCPYGEELSLIVNTRKADGMTAKFMKRSKAEFYVDSAVKNTNEYVIYAVKDALVQGTRPPFGDDEVLITPEADIMRVNPELFEMRKARVGTFAYKFRLAIITHPTYSQFHGNTIESVVAALITLMDRVNGVYVHEFGVYFQFIENFENGICLAGTSDSACNSLPNNGGILSVSRSFLNGKGIPYDSYDIGHSMTTGSGGVAQYPALCTLNNKAQGTTGRPSPVNDPYAIDYVAHEMGHQLFGAHSFRDCNGPNDGNIMLEGAVEPGSGSSIMGYAGICGSNDLQPNSDPYFNNVNIVQMYNYVIGVAENGVCGEEIDLNNDLPSVSIPDSCEVPLGNAFQLKGTTDTDPISETFYSIDRVDTGIEDFSSTTLGKFRPWKPTKAASRFFPNLVFLNFPASEGSKDIERLPSIARSMTFRFAERRLYDTAVTAPQFDLGMMGDFVYDDIEVNFVNVGKLTLLAPQSGTNLAPNAPFEFRWTPGGTPSLSDNVEIYIALNTLAPTNNFDYEIHNKELDWVLIGTAPASAGSAVFSVPLLVEDEDAPVNVMIRASSLSGSSRDQCFFFDIATDVTLTEDVGATLSPTVTEVTSSPTPFPGTVFPTPFPVAPTNPPVPGSNPPTPPSGGTLPPVNPPTGDGDGLFGGVSETLVAWIMALMFIVIALAGILVCCIVISPDTEFGLVAKKLLGKNSIEAEKKKEKLEKAEIKRIRQSIKKQRKESMDNGESITTANAMFSEL